MKAILRDIAGANGDNEALLRILTRLGVRNLGALGRNAVATLAVLYGAQQGLVPFFPSTLGVAGGEVAAITKQASALAARLDDYSAEQSHLTKEFIAFRARAEAELQAIRDASARIETRINAHWR